MATAAATPIQQPRKREMVEVKAPEQFQFNKEGQTLSGVLVMIEPKDVKGKLVPEYLFQDGNRRFTCLATADLEKKIQPAHIGHWLDVRYERDDGSFQKEGQSKMKIFKVLASAAKEPGFEHLGV